MSGASQPVTNAEPWRVGKTSTLMTLYVASFLYTLSQNTYSPFIPVFARGFGAPYLVLGVVAFANSLPYIITSLFVGFFTRRIGPTRLMVITATLNATAVSLFSLANSVLVIILLRFVSGAVSGLFWPCADALASRSSRPGERTKTFGRYTAAWGSSILVGPLIGGFLSSAIGLRHVFLVSSLIGFSTAGVVAVGLWRHRLDTFSQDETVVLNLGVQSSLYPLIFITVIFNSAVGILFSIFPGYAASLGAATFEIGILFSTYATIRLVFFLLSARISRLGFIGSLGLSAVTMITSFLVMGSTNSPVWFALAFGLFGVSVGVFYPFAMNLFTQASPRIKIEGAMGLFEASSSGGALVGPLLGGFVADSISPNAPYFLSSGLGLVMVPAVIWARGKVR